MSIFSFRKDEILRKKKFIDRLFAEGSSFYIYPFKVFYLITPLEADFPAQVMISVGKRSFRNAVDRNRIRRQVREAYRLNKQPLYEFLVSKNSQCVLAFIYTANIHLPGAEHQIKIKAAVKRLCNEIERKLNNQLPVLS